MLTWHADCSPQAVDRQNGDSYNEQSAKAAGLRYGWDAAEGIRRRKAGNGFRYIRPDGSAVRDRESLNRIRALAVPPAWRGVWICPRDDGHLQATGRDARGRKQYRYHARWREARDESKYGRMPAFAKALPAIRRRVHQDLALPGLPREKVLATVVRLLETTLIRVGNDEYARQNDSFGLTTLRERQVRVRGGTLQFRFRGKSGVRHDIELTDLRLAKIVRRMQDLPGEELIQYVDDSGETRRIESADVNAYLKQITGDDFTSKDFRTWAGSVLAVRALRRSKTCASQAQARRQLALAIESVARQLGNTTAVCRKCYVHPAVIDAYLDGSLPQRAQGRREEAAVLAIVRAARNGATHRSLVPLLRRSLAQTRLTARSLREKHGNPTHARGAPPWN
jgi:DNA topoisomerase-1